MTLISVFDSDGCVGRCDAKCYEASSPVHTCDCVCHGKNHGVGLKKAESNVREYGEEMARKYIEAKNIKNGLSEIEKSIYQLSLF